jgi:AbrB family looped-hinge helix DNA binding protein
MELERVISSKGQVVVPKYARKRLGFKPGSEIVFEIENDKLVIKKKMSAKKFVEDFAKVPKKIKGLSAKKIKRILEEEYEIP